MAKLCKNCGAWADDGDKFCQHCGNNLSCIDDPVVVDAEPEIVDAEIIAPVRRYESPAADAREVRERLVGTKTEYYLPRFEKFETLNSFISWNWPAFLVGASWLVYRKMYVFGIVYWLLGELLVNTLGIGLMRWVLWIASGVLGNFLYMKDIDRRTEKAMNMQPEEREVYIQKNSGTSWAAVLILLVGTAVIVNLF